MIYTGGSRNNKLENHIFFSYILEIQNILVLFESSPIRGVRNENISIQPGMYVFLKRAFLQYLLFINMIINNNHYSN